MLDWFSVHFDNSSDSSETTFDRNISNSKRNRTTQKPNGRRLRTQAFEVMRFITVLRRVSRNRTIRTFLLNRTKKNRFVIGRPDGERVRPCVYTIYTCARRCGNGNWKRLPTGAGILFYYYRVLRKNCVIFPGLKICTDVMRWTTMTISANDFPTNTVDRNR